jgi:hypothetical protein
MKNKVFIWGHNGDGHTHGHIHSAYFRAFKDMGFESYWINSKGNLKDEDFNESIFFTHHIVMNGMPLIKSCKYITHHANINHFLNAGIPRENILQLGNYIHKEEIHEKINETAYWNDSARTLYQTWATDLLPHEIDENNSIPFNKSAENFNYVGTMYEQGSWWFNSFSNILKNGHKVNCRLIGGFGRPVSFQENIKLARESFLCPDFRSDWHLECGYIPCRAYKNISYGRVAGTNSPWVKRALGDYIVYGGTPSTLYGKLIDAELNNKINMREAMLYVKDKHTYVNRIKTILKFL